MLREVFRAFQFIFSTHRIFFVRLSRKFVQNFQTGCRRNYFAVLEVGQSFAASTQNYLCDCSKDTEYFYGWDEDVGSFGSHSSHACFDLQQHQIKDNVPNVETVGRLRQQSGCHKVASVTQIQFYFHFSSLLESTIIEVSGFLSFFGFHRA